jgi:hypothetical protein
VTDDYLNVPPTHPGMTPLGPAQPKRSRWKAWLLGILALGIGVGIGAAAKGAPTRTVAGPTVTATTTATVTTPGPTVTATVTTRRAVTATRTVTPQPAASFGDGTYVVGTDLQPGRYKTDGKSDSFGCYWARDGDLSGENILANGIVNGPTTVEVRSGDTAFEVSGGCQWAKIG